MSKVLVISGHPNLDSSYTNKVILEQAENNVHDVQVRRLDTLYPDFQIDVEAEQQALLDADVIVLQFPFYWYSIPALLKKWIDDVFSYNFAYGSKGDKLKGKDFLLSFTIGGPSESYDPLGYNHFSIEQLLMPLQQTAYLAGINFQKPLYSHGMVFIPGVYNTQEGVEAKAMEHGNELVSRINALVDSTENRVKKLVKEWFAELDVLPESGDYFLDSLSQDITWIAPESEFNGHAGFNDWYQTVRGIFKPDCQHIVEAVEVFENGNDINAELRIRLIADTFEGDSVNLLVNEKWDLAEQNGRFVITHYLIEPVQE
ncbi:FMN reductase [Vibrio breoganii]|uniref:NAD(P)H-dependent oxidoreductase n=1 Tax=Vibrio breoganii TaxID=553239 RepID=A0ABX1UB95_9VIBR|nr:NAD(P)H-dependent oxidoreductase [Vibrio breoganii]NMO74470.1 NAD(P)H-dependent oxidoreductase [Vibrio breoganii]NMR71787.1 NAD(P)H-dependent oxidoreductase [Vibrio breoganii]PMG03093.1 FMN reductase [Vibrio breoganii]PML92224.1 FMN reductase [Vibrio breoganii]